MRALRPGRAGVGQLWRPYVQDLGRGPRLEARRPGRAEGGPRRERGGEAVARAGRQGRGESLSGGSIAGGPTQGRRPAAESEAASGGRRRGEEDRATPC